MMEASEDPFDSLLSLEDDFYKEGHDLGVSDGNRSGRVEGRLFGLEKGFEKYAAMGRMHGKAVIWAGRISDSLDGNGITKRNEVKRNQEVTGDAEDEESSQATEEHAPWLPASTRLETHVRTLYALTEPGSLSTTNNEDSVSEFDDRLRRAEGKTRILEKLTGEFDHENATDHPLSPSRKATSQKFPAKEGDGSIEDISSLHARH